MNLINKYLTKLSDSEKKLLLRGGIIVLITLLWTFIYQPVTKNIQSKVNQKLMLQNQLSEMKSSEGLFIQKKSNDVKYHRDLNKPFISWIDEQLLKNKLSQFITRSEPKDNQTLILNFESIVFDDLIEWLQPLERNFGINISEADMTLIDRSTGICNARITLEENK